MAGKKAVKKSKASEDVDEHAGGASLDDAFADDDGVDYAKAKPVKVKKKQKDEALEDEIDAELDVIERGVGELSLESGPVDVKGSKPIEQLKKGNTLLVNGMKLEVDAHMMLIDHGSTKEMAIDAFDMKTDKDYQIRYFADQVEATLELYELKEIMYIKVPLKTIVW
ncbi:hypothetical protein EXS73_01630 [Candidatus Pacearchaeota archaeon]|nr:hypothetical protein [Candidatus Pacearchaeota archaeon]